MRVCNLNVHQIQLCTEHGKTSLTLSYLTIVRLNCLILNNFYDFAIKKQTSIVGFDASVQLSGGKMKACCDK